MRSRSARCARRIPRARRRQKSAFDGVRRLDPCRAAGPVGCPPGRCPRAHNVPAGWCVPLRALPVLPRSPQHRRGCGVGGAAAARAWHLAGRARTELWRRRPRGLCARVRARRGGLRRRAALAPREAGAGGRSGALAVDAGRAARATQPVPVRHVVPLRCEASERRLALLRWRSWSARQRAAPLAQPYSRADLSRLHHARQSP